jgi:predicted DNA-binding protein
MKKMMIYLEAEQHEALRKLAYEDRRTMSEHIRRAIDKYLETMKERKPGD